VLLGRRDYPRFWVLSTPAVISLLGSLVPLQEGTTSEAGFPVFSLESSMSNRSSELPLAASPSPPPEPPKPDPFERPDAQPSASSAMMGKGEPLPPSINTGPTRRPSKRELRRLGLAPRKPPRGTVARAMLDEEVWINRGR